MTSPMTAKAIRSLLEKKYRENTKKFLVEGEKNVLELIKSDIQIDSVFATREFQKKYGKILEEKNIRVQQVEASELTSYGTLEHNNDAIAIAFQKKTTFPETTEGVTLVVDDVRDPGNLGTLIRIADWYGIKNIVCSTSSVDWYNPKVINATMGSFTRVNCFYVDLPNFLAKQKAPKIGTFLKGKSSHTFEYPKNGILILGSESHGISHDVAQYITEKVTIPGFGHSNNLTTSKAESLNIAVAGAVILDRWMSQHNN